MGYAGKLEQKKIAQKLRSQGFPYSEIRKKVSVSKSTISLWCRDVILTVDQLERIRKKSLEGAERGRIIGAKKQQASRIKRTQELFLQGRKQIGRMTKRDRFMAGVGLYLGDGVKGDREVGFSNSNPKVIEFMIRWFREFCTIPEDKFRGHLWIHEGLNEMTARKYWSKTTKIPLGQFNKSYIAKNKSRSRKIRKQLHKHGVFAIRASDSTVQRQILGWLGGILR